MLYTFREFRLNGAFLGTDPTVLKTFSTTDPVNMDYVAVYDSSSILPIITNFVSNTGLIVPATNALP